MREERGRMIRGLDSRSARWSMLAALALLAACGQPEAPPPASGDDAMPKLPAELAEIEAAAREFPVIEGEEQVGDAQLSYRAYVDGDRPRFVEEVVNGEYSATRDRYYFAEGRLTYFHREGSQLIAMPPDPPGLGDVVMFVSFDDTGRPGGQQKRLKGRPAEIEPFEIAAISNRAIQLAREVRLRQREPLDEGEIEGYLVMGEPLTTFQPCGDPKIYWVDAAAADMSGLRAEYDRTASQPMEPLYVRIKGEFGERIMTGIASNYPAVLHVDSHSIISRREQRDCP